MQTVYPSKIDAISAAPFIVAAFGALAASLVIAGSAIPAPWLLIGLVLIVLVAFPVWILTTTDYTFTSNELVIRSGPFCWKVPFSDIVAVERSGSRRSGPALSLDRIRIDYGRGRSVLISPREKEAFLLELYSRRNELSRQQ